MMAQNGMKIEYKQYMGRTACDVFGDKDKGNHEKEGI